MISSYKSLGILIFPKNCIGCGEFNIEICKKCNQIITWPASKEIKQGLTIFSGAKFSIVYSRIILAAKENNNFFAREILAKSVLSALVQLDLGGELLNQRTIVLIPIPSRNSANRVRGIKHTILLGELIREQWPKKNIEIINCLKHNRRIKDQSQLSMLQRKQNMKGAFKVDLRTAGETRNLQRADSIIFILDDLVTTGSTVASAKAALNQAGIGVFGVLASCSSQLKHALR